MAQFHRVALNFAFGEVGESKVKAHIGLKCSHMEARKAAPEEGPQSFRLTRCHLTAEGMVGKEIIRLQTSLWESSAGEWYRSPERLACRGRHCHAGVVKGGPRPGAEPLQSLDMDAGLRDVEKKAERIPARTTADHEGVEESGWKGCEVREWKSPAAVEGPVVTGTW